MSGAIQPSPACGTRGTATSVRVVPAGETVSLRPGDFILVRRRGFVQACIRVGQRIRYRHQREFTEWSHAALAIAPDRVLEALTRGVTRTDLSAYHNVEYVVVQIDATPEQRGAVLTFAAWIDDERYGWASILTIALSTIPGWHLTIGWARTMICSAVVARGLERVGAAWDDPMDVMPADLARVFNVPRRVRK